MNFVITEEFWSLWVTLQPEAPIRKMYIALPHINGFPLRKTYGCVMSSRDIRILAFHLTQGLRKAFHWILSPLIVALNVDFTRRWILVYVPLYKASPIDLIPSDTSSIAGAA